MSVLKFDWCSVCVGEFTLVQQLHRDKYITKGILPKGRICFVSTFVSDTVAIFLSSFKKWKGNLHNSCSIILVDIPLHKRWGEFKLEAGFLLLCHHHLLLFFLAGTLCYVSTSTSRPNLALWPCRSQNERRTDCGEKTGGREGVTGFMLRRPVGWELFSVSQLLMDHCLVLLFHHNSSSRMMKLPWVMCVWVYARVYLCS